MHTHKLAGSWCALTSHFSCEGLSTAEVSPSYLVTKWVSDPWPPVCKADQWNMLFTFHSEEWPHEENELKEKTRWSAHSCDMMPIMKWQVNFNWTNVVFEMSFEEACANQNSYRQQLGQMEKIRGLSSVDVLTNMKSMSVLLLNYSSCAFPSQHTPWANK